jgi:hypothetical protein
VGGKLTNDESQFEEDTLFNLIFRWSYSSTLPNWGTITDAYWICMAWMKVFDKENAKCEIANDEPSVVFTKKVELFLNQFGSVDLDKTQNDPLAGLLSDITNLKDSYKALLGAI